MNKKLPTVQGEGLAFMASLKDRNQITLDSNIIKLLNLKKGGIYNFMIILAEE